MYIIGNLLRGCKERISPFCITKQTQARTYLFSRETIISPQVDSTICHTQFILNILDNGGGWLCSLTVEEK